MFWVRMNCASCFRRRSKAKRLIAVIPLNKMIGYIDADTRSLLGLQAGRIMIPPADGGDDV